MSVLHPEPPGSDNIGGENAGGDNGVGGTGCAGIGDERTGTAGTGDEQTGGDNGFGRTSGAGIGDERTGGNAGFGGTGGAGIGVERTGIAAGGSDRTGGETTRGVARRGTPGEILLTFLLLGLTSFGGPVAHIGYFRQAFVERRRWLDEASFADLVALSQFLPGPASSQVVFSLGLMRGGWGGGLAASAGFTLPSAIAMLLFAYLAKDMSGALGAGVIHGLKLVAVAIVAQAVWGMASSLCPDRTRAGIALAALVLVTVTASASAATVFPAIGTMGQVAAIVFGGCAGALLCRGAPAAATGQLPPIPVSRGAGMLLLAVFAVLLVLPPLLLAGPVRSQGLALFEAFYRSGALVFGGGHVVLPLLREAVVAPGWVTQDAFLAGYGAAQAVPGPLFTFSAYLGAVMGPAPNGVAGAVIALVAIFSPGLLLISGVLPFWDAFRRRPSAQAAMRGTNAAVVGILAAALYNPVWTSAVTGPADFAIAAFGFVLLAVWRVPPLAVVVAITLAAITLVAITLAGVAPAVPG